MLSLCDVDQNNCAGKLQVYVWSEMLALFAGAPYGQDLTDLRAHLTNTCRQSSAAVGSGDAGYQEADAVKLLSELPEVMTDPYHLVPVSYMDSHMLRCCTPVHTVH